MRLQCYHRERLANGTQRYVLRRTVSATAADHSTYTKYKASVSLLYVGSWRIRAYHPADALNAATYSGWSYVTAK